MVDGQVWIPEGHYSSWDLHIEHARLPDAGEFTGGGRKLVWHTTEGLGVDAMWNVLRDKNAAPHFIIGKKGERQHLTAVQCIPLDKAARALAHPSGPETNRANAIQIEVCEFTRNAPKWSEDFYRALASLACLIDHRVDIPRNAPRSFATPKKYTGTGWVQAKGHVGHVHCPGNDHTDITGLRSTHLLNLMKEIDH